MNAPTFIRIEAHSGSSFGSKTTHWVPRNRLSSRNSASRRTGRYFHSSAIRSAPRSVRAPHDTGPITGKLRRQFTPSLFSWPFSRSVIGHVEAGDAAECGGGARRRLPDPPLHVGAGHDARRACRTGRRCGSPPSDGVGDLDSRGK